LLKMWKSSKEWEFHSFPFFKNYFFSLDWYENPHWSLVMTINYFLNDSFVLDGNSSIFFRNERIHPEQSGMIVKHLRNQSFFQLTIC
jgi:hypothetical protein